MTLNTLGPGYGRKPYSLKENATDGSRLHEDYQKPLSYAGKNQTVKSDDDGNPVTFELGIFSHIEGMRHSFSSTAILLNTSSHNMFRPK